MVSEHINPPNHEGEKTQFFGYSDHDQTQLRAGGRDRRETANFKGNEEAKPKAKSSMSSSHPSNSIHHPVKASKKRTKKSPSKPRDLNPIQSEQ